MNFEEFVAKSQLADPCTLVFDIPREADRSGAWLARHWLHCAQRCGHHGTVVADDPPAIDVDGIAYLVKHGPRKRIMNFDGTNSWFELSESVWVEPIPPVPAPETCPWCLHGPPVSLSHVAEDTSDDELYVLGASELANGEGRAFTLQLPLDENDDDGYCLTLEPGHGTHYGGISRYQIDNEHLRFELDPDASTALRVPPVLDFQLSISAEEASLLRNGLSRVLGQ